MEVAMRAVPIATICVATLLAAANASTGCSSSNNPSTTAGSGASSSGSATGSGASSGSPGASGSGSAGSGAAGSGSGMSSTSGSGASGASTSGASTSGASDAGASSGATDSGTGGPPASCDTIADGGVTDKVTTCTTGTSPSCSKGCGPNLPSGSAQTNLGVKTCTCTAGTYNCGTCVYESPLPGCYQAAASPAPVACAAGTVNKGSCTSPCSDAGTSGVCNIVGDAGKTQGRVCVPGGAGDVWTCATQWW